MLGKPIMLLDGSANACNYENYDGQYDRQPSRETQFLSDRRIDIVRVGDGNDFGKAEPEPAPGCLSGRNAKDRLGRLKSKFVEPDIRVDALFHRLALLGAFFHARVFGQGFF